MARRVILDTTELIEIERGNSSFSDDDEVAIAAVSLAELEVGAFSTSDPERAERRHRFAAQLPKKIKVLEYTAETARHHAFLLSFVKRAGRLRGAHDIIIAAHARETGREIISDDGKARFGELPGVSVAQ